MQSGTRNNLEKLSRFANRDRHTEVTSLSYSMLCFANLAPRAMPIYRKAGPSSVCEDRLPGMVYAIFTRTTHILLDTIVI